MERAGLRGCAKGCQGAPSPQPRTRKLVEDLGRHFPNEKCSATARSQVVFPESPLCFFLTASRTPAPLQLATASSLGSS